MDFLTPATENAIDRQRVVSKPLDRVDGPMKVAGLARYAYEYNDEVKNAAYGFLLGAGIGKGRIEAIDAGEAENAPGVLLVLTHRNTPEQGTGRNTKPQLADAEVKFYEQSVAFVVAETFERARAAAKLIRVTYKAEPGRFDLQAEKDNGKAVSASMGPADTAVGDFEGAYAAASAKIDVTYTTPDQSHAMMEPHASTAAWDGDKLTIYTATQMIHWSVRDIANTLMVDKADVRVVSRYIGGGFGSKLYTYGDAILSAMAARLLKRPVKVALTRPQIFNHTNHRPATIQRLQIAAGTDGRITAISHDAWCGNQPDGEAERAADQTRTLYAGANRRTRQRVSTMDLPIGGAMRAPGEAVGLLALECAMDELAEKLNMDPIEFRVLNDTQYDPEKGPSRPFSSRKLVECLRTGATHFGWNRRNMKPAQVRDGRWLVGIGVASAIRDNLVQPSKARARLGADGVLTIETSMTDIGTGSYTILAQVAAETMGVDPGKVVVHLGDSLFPQGAGSGGSWGANSASSGVYAACMALRDKAADAAGFARGDAVFEDGLIRSGNRSKSLAEVAGPDGITVEDGITFGDLTKKYAQASFGAHFTEVAVDIDTAEVRVRRMLSVCAAGRIINPKTSRSQCLGGMTMGLGAALMEEQVVDTRFGYFVNHDLAEYQVPVHADIGHMEVIFLEEMDDKSSPIKAKGVGELGICGVGASVANAVYNATGIRVRDYPITLDKLIAQMPNAA